MLDSGEVKLAAEGLAERDSIQCPSPSRHPEAFYEVMAAAVDIDIPLFEEQVYGRAELGVSWSMRRASVRARTAASR